MGLGVDFAAQDLLCTDNGQLSHALTQAFLGTHHFLFDLGLGSGDDTVSFNLRLGLGFVE